MTYIIYKDGIVENRIVADEAFCQKYYSANGYTYQEEKTIIKIEPNDDWSHNSQTGSASVFPPEGWAVVPEDMMPLANFPFGEVTVADVDGVPTVTSWMPLPMPEPEPEPEPEQLPTQLDGMVPNLKEAKMAELSAACNTAIVSGCNVVLTDGSTGHISLTAEDQINLSTAMSAVEQGAESYPYHLDGQLCALYPAADIVAMAQAHGSQAVPHHLLQSSRGMGAALRDSRGGIRHYIRRSAAGGPGGERGGNHCGSRR